MLERKLAALLLVLAGLYQTVGWGTLQFDRKGYSASWLHYSYFWLGYTKPLGGTPYSLIEKVIAQTGCITPRSGRVIPNRWVGHLTVWSIRLYRKLAPLLLFLAGLYQTVGWGTLQLDRKCYSASWLRYSYFWPGYTKPLGGAPYSLIENVIAQAGCITPSSGRVIPNRWVGHLTVWSIRLYRKLAALLLFLAGLYQTVGWDTLQFDRQDYSASWLHYSYFWLDYTKPLGGTPYSLIEKVIAQAGCITPISGWVIPNRWVGHLTVWSKML